LSARSAALAGWIAAKETSIAPAQRNFFIRPAPGSWHLAIDKVDSTLANRRTESCDTSATFQENTRIGGLDGLTVGNRRGIRSVRRGLALLGAHAIRIAAVVSVRTGLSGPEIDLQRNEIGAGSARFGACLPARLPAPNPLAISAIGCRSPSGRLLCLSADRRRDKMVEVPNHVSFCG
jgi:hypothetical protein